MEFYKLFFAVLLLIFMIGAVSAIDGDNITCDDANVLTQQDNTKIIYVNDTGDDSNTGSVERPYATIERAIYDVSSSDNATIYLNEGTFGSFKDTNFNINLDHQLNGGNLKIIGAGNDKTFIDGKFSSRFAIFDEYTNITLKDLTFINFRANDGGTINTLGILNIENCIFKNSYSVGVKGGAVCAGSEDYLDENSIQSLVVKNSQFINCSVNSDENIFECQGGGAIFAMFYSNVYLENNTFINSRISKKTDNGVAIHIHRCENILINENKFINLTGNQDASIYINKDGCNLINNTIKNNIFINCTANSDESSIVQLFMGSYFIKNNTFINSSNSRGSIYANFANIYYLNFYTSCDEIEYGDYEFNNGVIIPIKATDDNGNIVSCSNFNINLINQNNSYSYGVIPTGENIYFKLNNIISNGLYNLSVQYNNYPNFISSDVLTTFRVNISDSLVELYVSTEGNNANDGSKNHPFKNIQYAIDVGFERTSNVIVHLLKGTYYGEGNIELNINNKGTLQIIGETNNECLIDGEDAKWFYNSISTNLTIINVSFINCKSNSNHLIEGGVLKNCIVANNNVNNDQKYVIQSTTLDNVVYTNNYGRIRVFSSNSVYNSYFTNNEFSSPSAGGILLISKIGNERAIVENCSFINNTSFQAGVIITDDGFISRNNYYANNNANQSLKETYWVSASFGVICTSNGGTYTFENDTFENNSAYKCGVIGWHYGSNDISTSPKYTFTGCKFINNQAEEGGVTIINVATFTDCVFIENYADYGGAISLLPYIKDSSVLELNNVTFTNNIAKYKGSDIYLSPRNSNYFDGEDYIYPLDLTINFNDLNTSYISDKLVANVTGPYGAKIGGSILYFKLNDNEIGSSEIIDSIVTLNYVGFKDGKYDISGRVDLQSDKTIVNNATLNVKLGNILDNVILWVSTNGSDENGNGSIDNPFKSISHAVFCASKNSQNIIINIGEGVYSGDMNTALTLSSQNNITLKGAGINETIVDGENTNYFATITSGNNKVVISNLTIKNMLPNNGKSMEINPYVPVKVENGANLLLDCVKIYNNHGGEAIIQNNGNLTVKNSIFERNGFSNSGIISGGNVSIYSTYIADNFEKMGLITSDFVIIKDSVIKNAFNYYPLFSARGLYSLILGDTLIIENTEISNDGDNSSLESFGFEKNDMIVPAVSIESINVIMSNCSMIANYKSFVNIKESTTVGYSTYLAPFGYLKRLQNVTVFNSSFENFKYLWVDNTLAKNILIFDGCYFNNFTNIAGSFSISANSNYVFNNSVFNNVGLIINRDYYSHRFNPNIDFNNNYWGNNSQPIISYSDRGQTLLENIPKSWIILTEDEGLYKFKVTDGENITEYEGILPAKISYVADENGDVIPVVNINGDGYKLVTDEYGNLMINTSAEPIKNIVPKVPVDETVFASDVSLKVGEATVFTANFTDKWGNPLKNTKVSFIIGENTINKTTNDKGIASFDIDFDFGDYTVVIANLVTGQSISKTITVTTDDTIIASDVSVKFGDGSKFTVTFTDQYGNALTNINVTFKVGEKTINATTDVNGIASFSIDFNLGVYTVVITNPITGQSISKTITVTVEDTIIANDVSATYGDGSKFTVTFTDQYGKTLVNINVTFKVGENIIDAITDANGTASIPIDFNAGNYNVTIANPVSGQSIIKTITVNKIATKLNAPAVNTVYNVGKNLVATLTDAQGNVLSNTKVSITINGKTTPLTTDKNGQVKLAIKLPVKTYAATITYSGSSNYLKSSVNAKVIVKKATPKITAKAKTFKKSVKTKKYAITLKNNKNKVMKNTKVYIKVNGKTYAAKTNSKGKATFKITKLTKKGTFKATITYKGSKYYNKVTKKVNIKVK